jgi:hypothetical protein
LTDRRLKSAVAARRAHRLLAPADSIAGLLRRQP